MKRQDELKLQRNTEKRNFYKRFRLRIIEDHYRRKLYKLFCDRCYNCGDTEEIDLTYRKPCNLSLDHHVPLIHGGHYELGNLVVLCRRCNGIKHQKMPSDFYVADKLANLELVLAKQRGIDFAFEFDWNFWLKDRAGYLASLGIGPELIEIALTNELHPYYIEPFDERRSIGFIIRCDLPDK